MSTIAAAGDSANGRIRLTVTPTATGTVYVFRRDAAGVGNVRATTEGLAVTSGTPVIVDDYEPRQGASTDYLLTDQDGVLQASTTLTAPTWGTWLKSPGRPWLNVLTALNDDGTKAIPVNRQAVQVEGADYLTVLSGRRPGGTGTITLAVRTAAELAALTDLITDGGTLMLDCNPDWNVPWRYVNVGGVNVRRVYQELGLDKTWRLVELTDCLAAAMPLGPLEVNPTATYAGLPIKFVSYASMAAVSATYNALAVA